MLFNDIVCKNILILKKQQVNEQRNASVDNFLRIIFVYNAGGSNFMPSNKDLSLCRISFIYTSIRNIPFWTVRLASLVWSIKQCRME